MPYKYEFYVKQSNYCTSWGLTQPRNTLHLSHPFTISLPVYLIHHLPIQIHFLPSNKLGCVTSSPSLHPLFCASNAPANNSHLILYISYRLNEGHCKPSCDSAIAQAKYCNSFQLTHTPRGNHAQSIVIREQWRPK